MHSLRKFHRQNSFLHVYRAMSETITGRIAPGWETNEYVVSIVFALITSVIKSVEAIPWSLYSTFVIEERHGFNKQTLGLFFTDLIKSVRTLLASRLCAIRDQFNHRTIGSHSTAMHE